MDYCTLWFEGWWSHCCQAHDADYSVQIGQALADGQLFSCVVNSLPAAALDNPLLAAGAGAASLVIGGGMWLGVRVFGRRFYKNAANTGGANE